MTRSLGGVAERAAEKVLKVIFESMEVADISEADEIPGGPEAGPAIGEAS